MKINFFLILSLFILLVSCGNKNISTNTKKDVGPEVQAPVEREEEINLYSGTYLAKFETLNSQFNGNIPGSMTIHFKEERVYFYIRLFGAHPRAWHPQKMYLGNRCPNLEDDSNNDGFLDINEVEKVVGKIIIPIDANLSTQNAGKNFYPTGDLSGNYSYERLTRIQSLIDDLRKDDFDPEDNLVKLKPDESLQIEGRPIVIYGTGSEVILPESITTQGELKPFKTFPIVCGILKKIENFPGVPDLEIIPGPVEPMPEEKPEEEEMSN